MCHSTKCKTCGKTTWSGCGQHVNHVKARVPAGQWCGGKHSPAERAAAGPPQGGFLSRFFGRD